jgi:ankyrin repeat protein
VCLQGAKVDAVDKDKLTPLIEASITGHVDVVKELLKQGASVDAQVANGATALWLAAGKLPLCLALRVNCKSECRQRTLPQSLPNTAT